VRNSAPAGLNLSLGKREPRRGAAPPCGPLRAGSLRVPSVTSHIARDNPTDQSGVETCPLCCAPAPLAKVRCIFGATGSFEYFRPRGRLVDMARAPRPFPGSGHNPGNFNKARRPPRRKSLVYSFGATHQTESLPACWSFLVGPGAGDFPSLADRWNLQPVFTTASRRSVLPRRVCPDVPT